MMSLKSSVTKGLIHVLCAFVLFAQQGALTHVVWHAAAGQSAQGHDADVYENERTPAPELSGLCLFDAAFGQVLGIGPATHHTAHFGTAVSQGALHRSRACTAAAAPTPRSRGPPALL